MFPCIRPQLILTIILNTSQTVFNESTFHSFQAVKIGYISECRPTLKPSYNELCFAVILQCAGVTFVAVGAWAFVENNKFSSDSSNDDSPKYANVFDVVFDLTI